MRVLSQVAMTQLARTARGRTCTCLLITSATRLRMTQLSSIVREHAGTSPELHESAHH